MDGIMKWLPLGAAVLAGGIAWGAQQQQIEVIERALYKQAQIQEAQAELRVQGARTEAKSTQAADLAKQNHELLIQLLQRLGN